MTPGENEKSYFFADRLLYLPRIDLDGHISLVDENKMSIKSLQRKFKSLWNHRKGKIIKIIHYH